MCFVSLFVNKGDQVTTNHTLVFVVHTYFQLVARFHLDSKEVPLN